MKTLLVMVGALVLLGGCGTELGRVPFAAEGSADSTLTLAAGEVAFWADLDIEYEGDAALAYKVDLLQGAAVVASVRCDPLGPMSVKTSWVEVNLGNRHSRRGNGKMACKATLPKGGATVVRAQLAFGKRPASVTLKKADLAIRQ